MNTIKHFLMLCLITGPLQVYAQFISATAIHPTSERIKQGTPDNPVLRIQVIVSGAVSPVISSFDLSASGTTDTADIRNMKIFYTGNTDTFNTTTGFGDTLAYLPGASGFDFMINGSMVLNADTNYFWLTYDINNVAAFGNSIDAGCNGMIINGLLQIPLVTAPAGNRNVTGNYCVPGVTNAINSCTVTNAYIKSVTTTGALINISDSNNGCAGGVNNYMFHSNHQLTVAKNTPFGIALDGGMVNRGYAVWIDLNRDGTFDPVSEKVYGALPATATSTSGFITLPCWAKPGLTMMRIRINIGGIGIPADACATQLYGETEDYEVMIVENPVTYSGHTALQQTGKASPGKTDKPVLRIPVRIDNCGTATLTSFTLNTAGSTDAVNDITSAKLYVTGKSSVFTTDHLLAAVPSPSGVFSFTITDTLINNDTTNYWLVYDVNPFATLNNILDAVLDSIHVNGLSYAPVNGNPAGAVEVMLPMSYISSAVIQNDTSRVGRGTTHNEIIGVQVITSSTGAPVLLTHLDFDANGTTDTADIHHIRVFYTGNSNEFDTIAQFGSTLVSLPGVSTTFAVTGETELTNDTNYFWLTYSIADAADTSTHVVDAECTGMSVAGSYVTPSVTDPSGSRKIRLAYCTPSYVTGAYCALNQFTYAGINHSNITVPAAPAYSYHKKIYATVMQGGTNSLSITFSQSNLVPGMCNASVWIDFNDDGIFATAERILSNAVSSNLLISQNITIPDTAVTGVHRMRIRSGNVLVSNLNPCGTAYAAGQAIDFMVNVLPAPASPIVYTWNRTGTAGMNNPGNWTPERSSMHPSDILLFNGGGTVTADSVVTQMIQQLRIENNTIVNMNAAANDQTVTIEDSLILDGTIASTNTGLRAVTLSLGKDTSNTGSLTGNGNIEGTMKLKRWINTTVPSYRFPLASSDKNRNMLIFFAVPPLVSGSVTASFTTDDPGNAGLPLTDTGITVNKISSAGYWNLVSGNGLTGGIYDLVVGAENISGVTNPNELIIVYRANTASSWNTAGTYIAPLPGTVFPEISRAGVAGWGQFAIAADSTVNPLPVALLSFTGEAVHHDVLLSWATASEIRNRGFYIERSAMADGDWRKVGFVKGKGMGNLLRSYTFTDPGALSVAVLYYRLRQVDDNGQETESGVIAVNKRDMETSSLTVYPNPVTDRIGITLDAGYEGISIVRLFDMTGRIVWQQELNLAKGYNMIEIKDIDVLRKGLHLLTLDVNGRRFTAKVMKQ